MTEITQADYAERFWAKVDIQGENECWNWLASKASTNCAYGRFYIHRRKSRPAHQVAWELFNHKPFPSGKIGCHSCDNPSCVNPSHIWPGTQSENLKDCVNKGRHHSKPHDYCSRGHALTPENRRSKSQQSRCIICDRESAKQRTARYRSRKKGLPCD